jgi:hypothetical protein
LRRNNSATTVPSMAENASPRVSAQERSTDVVARTVRRINAMGASTALELTLAVGEVVLADLYEGDMGKLRSRNRKDHVTLRCVAADPALAMSASALYRSIAIFDVCSRIGRRSWRHVSSSHVRAVLPLDPSAQEDLLVMAERDRWSVREIERHAAAVAAAPQARSRRGGRKRRTRLRAVVDGIRREAEVVEGLIGEDDPLQDSSPESVRAATLAFERLRDLCVGMIARVKGEEPEV